MIGGGCNIPCPSDELGYLETTISNITAAFPGSDQYLVPYNNDPKQAQASTPLMIAAANDYFKSCPNTPVVFVGYSLGAVITMNTLCGGISASHAPNVLAAIVCHRPPPTHPYCSLLFILLTKPSPSGLRRRNIQIPRPLRPRHLQSQRPSLSPPKRINQLRSLCTNHPLLLAS